VSEIIVIGTGSETILGSHADAVAYIGMELGARYEAWAGKDPTTQKKSLVKAVRFLNAQVWTEEADTFAERDALQVNGKYVFREAQYELAVLVVEESTVTDAADQGSNIKAVGAGSASVEYFNPTTQGADLLPPILMRLIGSYLGATANDGPVAGGGCAGSSENPFSSCSDYDRGEPY
jgi:hypothetical protein